MKKTITIDCPKKYSDYTCWDCEFGGDRAGCRISYYKPYGKRIKVTLELKKGKD